MIVKSGDKVRCIKVADENNLTVGKTYEVRDSYESDSTEYILIKDDKGCVVSKFIWKFEKAVEPVTLDDELFTL